MDIDELAARMRAAAEGVDTEEHQLVSNATNVLAILDDRERLKRLPFAAIEEVERILREAPIDESPMNYLRRKRQEMVDAARGPA